MPRGRSKGRKRLTQSYLAIPRSILRDEIAKDCTLLGAYIVLQSQARWKPQEVEVTPRQVVTLAPGELLYSERLMVEWTGLSRRQVREAMAYFEKREWVQYPEGQNHRRPYALRLSNPWVRLRRDPEDRTKTEDIEAQRVRLRNPKEAYQAGPESEQNDTLNQHSPPTTWTKPKTPELLELQEVAKALKAKADQGLVQTFAPGKSPKGTDNFRKPDGVTTKEAKDLDRPRLPWEKPVEDVENEGKGGNIRGGKGSPPSVPDGELPPPTPPIEPRGMEELFNKLVTVGMRGHAPPEGRRHVHVQALTKLAKENSVRAVSRAISGMATLYPWSQGRPFTAQDLARHFDVAHAASDQAPGSPKAQAMRAEAEERRKKAEEVYESRFEEWVERIEARLAGESPELVEEIRQSALRGIPASVPPSVQESMLRVQVRSLYGARVKDPAPKLPAILGPS
jgi:hypothetical protein